MKRDLCNKCAILLGRAYDVKRVSGVVDGKVKCAQCGNRRYGATFEVKKKGGASNG